MAMKTKSGKIGKNFCMKEILLATILVFCGVSKIGDGRELRGFDFANSAIETASYNIEPEDATPDSTMKDEINGEEVDEEVYKSVEGYYREPTTEDQTYSLWMGLKWWTRLFNGDIKKSNTVIVVIFGTLVWFGFVSCIVYKYGVAMGALAVLATINLCVYIAICILMDSGLFTLMMFFLLQSACWLHVIRHIDLLEKLESQELVGDVDDDGDRFFSAQFSFSAGVYEYDNDEMTGRVSRRPHRCLIS